MKEYKAPRLKVGEVLKLFEDDYEQVVININKSPYTTIFDGEKQELLTKEGDEFDKLRDLVVTHIGCNDYCKMVLDVNEKECPVNRSIDEFPRRDMLLAELIQFMDHKEELLILEDDTHEELYRGRMEYLMYDGMGCLDSLCLREVEWFEAARTKDNYPETIVYLK